MGSGPMPCPDREPTRHLPENPGSLPPCLQNPPEGPEVGPPARTQREMDQLPIIDLAIIRSKGRRSRWIMVTACSRRYAGSCPRLHGRSTDRRSTRSEACGKQPSATDASCPQSRLRLRNCRSKKKSRPYLALVGTENRPRWVRGCGWASPRTRSGPGWARAARFRSHPASSNSGPSAELSSRLVDHRPDQRRSSALRGEPASATHRPSALPRGRISYPRPNPAQPGGPRSAESCGSSSG